MSKEESAVNTLSNLLLLIGQPARIQILMVIRKDVACVCHFENVLGMRQASISQHLMVLRKADLVSTIRVGRNIFYSLTHPEIIDVLLLASKVLGLNNNDLEILSARPTPGCPCPQCNPGFDPRHKC